MVAFRTIFVTLFLATSSFALPATTTIDSSLLGTRAVPAKRAPAPSAARRGLQKKKHVDSTHIPGNKKDYSPFLCPSPEAPVASTANTPAVPLLNKGNVVTQLRACPAPGTGIVGDIVRDMTPNELGAQMNTLADWFRIGFECIDFDNDVKNCGGCASFGLGQDCSAIPSATRATCSQASCHVAACQPGFVISKDKKSCVERSHKGGPDDELMDEAWEEEERLLEESDKQKVIGRKSSSR